MVIHGHEIEDNVTVLAQIFTAVGTRGLKSEKFRRPHLVPYT